MMRKPRSVVPLLWSIILSFSLVAPSISALSLRNNNNLLQKMVVVNRRRCLTVPSVVSAALALVALAQQPDAALSLSSAAFSTTTSTRSASDGGLTTNANNPQKLVAYKALSISVGAGDDDGVQVPVACWFPVDQTTTATTAAASANSAAPVRYQHRISVRKIGQLLAGWDFIPEFISKNYNLSPDSTALLSSSSSSSIIINGDALSLPSRAPVVLLAHGYLGSRFDLSHLAEYLTQNLGCVCLAPEYPESLAASYYDATRTADRARITNTLLETLDKDWNVQGTSFGIVGHSLGCGTALETNMANVDDDSWARVLIAGFPRLRDGRPVPGKNVLLLTSMNDGAVSLSRWGGKEAIAAASSDFTLLNVNDIHTTIDGGSGRRLPRRAALVLEGDNAPNHISFLAQNVNDAMMDFLSPLLPVAQALEIPVLDFDRYQVSRDSLPTAQLLHPLVAEYLKQHQMKQS